MMETMAPEPVIFLAVPHYGHITWPTCCSLLTASSRRHPMIVGEQASLLAHNFNRLWSECLNLRTRKGPHRKPTHFAMLHADVGPDPCWLDVLYDELTRIGADVLSVVVPIKDPRGLTSTGVQNVRTNGIRRFTLKEVFQFPETFDATGAGFPDRPLMVNTGCWLCRLDAPWVESFPGFTILDGIQQFGPERVPAVLSEDWHASRWWADHGVKVFATRKVKVRHYGDFGYTNHDPWGSWKYDKGDGACAPGGEIDGWMTPEELTWLRDEASKRQRVVEVGSWHGRSTRALAEKCPGQIIAVDHFQGSPDHPTLADAPTSGAGQEARENFHKNLAEELLTGKVQLLEMDSSRAAAIMSGYLLETEPSGAATIVKGYRPDMIFLDGNHEAAAVKADIRAWLPLLAPGGLLCGHDKDEPGVREALAECLPGWLPADAGTIWTYQPQPVG